MSSSRGGEATRDSRSTVGGLSLGFRRLTNIHLSNVMDDIRLVHVVVVAGSSGLGSTLS